MAKVTIQSLQQMKFQGEKIAMLTAYDATFARILDGAGVDALLVGDSLGMVIQGRENTLSVTLEEMIYHCRAVSRGASRAHLVGDLPFLSYQISIEEAVRSAGRLIKEGRVEAVKLEGGEEFADTVSAINRAGIPVMGHLGLTPQAIHKLGGFKVQGRDEEQAAKILSDARALEAAGCYAVVLEGIPGSLARRVTQAVSIPTIGIGAGIHCDGQVLVCYDLLGMDEFFKPKFVKRYDTLHARVSEAVRAFIGDVKERGFPLEENTFN
jgi:3-methyl-2-oxobutanoate hydroxymethyltransferase